MKNSMLVGVVCSLMVACGGPMEQGGSALQSGSGGGGGSSSGGGGTCCLNGNFYQCDSSAAFTACMGTDLGACHAACSVSDFQCNMRCDQANATATHDPSQCRRDASKDNTCSSSGGSCRSQLGLTACTYSTQCTSGNCTDGHCYGNGVGELCTYSTQCSSGNCTNGCCAGNSRGSACTYSTQCTSGNCTGGSCH